MCFGHSFVGGPAAVTALKLTLLGRLVWPPDDDLLRWLRRGLAVLPKGAVADRTPPVAGFALRSPCGWVDCGWWTWTMDVGWFMLDGVCGCIVGLLDDRVIQVAGW